MASTAPISVKADLLTPMQATALGHAGANLFDLMRKGSNGSIGLPLVSEIWPSLGRESKNSPILFLQSLDRIGGEIGKSGNSVLEGHFAFETPNSLGCSRRLIVKISPNATDRALGQKLIDEKRGAQNLRQVFASRERFALPLHHFRCPKTRLIVLWAPFASGDHIHELVTYLSTPKFPRGLTPQTRMKFLNGMITALRYLKDGHCQGVNLQRSNVNFLRHYAWELRDMLSQSSWTSPWHQLWTGRTLTDFGERGWPSPFKVCNALRARRDYSVRVGAIHGDLHPRNIVFAQGDTPRVIDFGWARPRFKDHGERLKPEHRQQHIAKDFVLLEANLRFMTLPPFLPHDEVKAMAHWNGMDSARPRVRNDEIRLRIDLISQIRVVAQEHIGKCDDWNAEYFIPLFLVSLGLLKHCHSADCTWAARYNVLALARNADTALGGSKTRRQP